MTSLQAAPALSAEERLDRLRLARSERVGPITFRRLLARYATAAEALAALPELAAAGGRTAPLTIASRAQAEREMARTARLRGELLVLGDPAYPPLLARLDDAPPVIAVLGDPRLLSRPGIGLVGSRNASANGQRMADMLAEALALAGFPVISGLARGIDAAAHEGALRGGTTIAAVAGGLDVPYPPEHTALQHRIAERGVVVTEAPPGTQPQARHFPRRNRLIAGLSLGVVVVEAALRSGSLITARLATEAGREVFAVPGSPLDPRCRGTNGLIRDGAWLVETADDVLAQLRPGADGQAMAQAGFAEPGPQPPDPFAPPPAPEDRTEVATRLLELLSPSPTSVDDLLRRCQFSPSAVLGVLLEMELAGELEMLSGNRVALLAN